MAKLLDFFSKKNKKNTKKTAAPSTQPHSINPVSPQSLDNIPPRTIDTTHSENKLHILPNTNDRFNISKPTNIVALDRLKKDPQYTATLDKVLKAKATPPTPLKPNKAVDEKQLQNTFDHENIFNLLIQPRDERTATTVQDDAITPGFKNLALAVKPVAFAKAQSPGFNDTTSIQSNEHNDAAYKQNASANSKDETNSIVAKKNKRERKVKFAEVVTHFSYPIQATNTFDPLLLHTFKKMEKLGFLCDLLRKTLTHEKSILAIGSEQGIHIYTHTIFDEVNNKFLKQKLNGNEFEAIKNFLNEYDQPNFYLDKVNREEFLVKMLELQATVDFANLFKSREDYLDVRDLISNFLLPTKDEEDDATVNPSFNHKKF